MGLQSECPGGDEQVTGHAAWFLGPVAMDLDLGECTGVSA